MAGEGLQNGEFAGGERLRLAVLLENAGAEVELEFAEADDFVVERRRAGGVGRRTAAKDGVDSGEQFARIEGLGDVVVGSDVKSFWDNIKNFRFVYIILPVCTCNRNKSRTSIRRRDCFAYSVFAFIAYALFTEPKSSIFSFTISFMPSKPGSRSFLGSKPLP